MLLNISKGSNNHKILNKNNKKVKNKQKILITNKSKNIKSCNCRRKLPFKQHMPNL